VRILSSLPDPATAGTGDASILFTDLRSAYRIADRLGMRIQRLTERYAEVGKVGMLATTRVGGDLVRPAAVAVYTQ
jgi:HK97 family phage major capsid protein